MHAFFSPVSSHRLRWVHWYTVVIVVLTVTMATMLMAGTYNKKNQIPGVIRSGTFVKVSSTASGVVTKVYVQLKEKVQPKTPLFDIEVSPDDSIHPDTKEQHSELQRRNLLQLKQNLHDNLLQIQRKSHELAENHRAAMRFNGDAIANIARSNELSLERIVSLRKQVEDLQTLVEKGSAKRIDLETLKIELLDTEAAFHNSKSRLQQQEQSRSDQKTSYSLHSMDLLQREFSLKAELSELEDKLGQLSKQSKTTVLAHNSGWIDSILVRVGDYYQAGQPIAILDLQESLDSMRVVLYVGSESIGLIDPEQEVVVRVDSFPYESHGVLKAKVIHIPKAGVSRENAEGQNSAVYPVVLKLVKDANTSIESSALQDGMTVTAYVSQQPLSLLEWVFLPVKKAFVRNPEFY